MLELNIGDIPSEIWYNCEVGKYRGGSSKGIEQKIGKRMCLELLRGIRHTELKPSFLKGRWELLKMGSKYRELFK